MQDLDTILKSLGISRPQIDSPEEPVMSYEEFLLKVGRSLQVARIERNLTIEIVALDVDIPVEVLHLIEKGQYNSTVGMISELCQYYGIRPRDFK